MSTRRKLIKAISLTLPLWFGSTFATSSLAQSPPQPSSAAEAASFPAKPVRLMVPYSPGGPTDTLARLIAQRLSEQWGQSVLIDHRPGAGTAIGVTNVATSPADGYSFGVVNSAFVINPMLRDNLTYKVDQLTGITQMVYVPLVLAANIDAPFNTLEELVAYAKENPGTLSYATPGAGGTSHLAGLLLNRRAGIDLLHIAYKGSAPAHTDVVGGRVPLLIDPLLSVTPLVQAGRLKIIALLSKERFPSAKQYPTVAETYPDFDVSTFLGLVAPAGTPAPIVEKIAVAVNQILQTPEDRSRIEELGMGVVGSNPEAFNQLIRTEQELWKRVIEEENIRIE